MLALGRMMSGRGTESCTMHQGLGSRVHGQMMPGTVLGYIALLAGIGWRGNGGRTNFMGAAPPTGPMETGWRRNGGRGSFMAAAPTTVPMETGWSRSGGRGSVMAAAPSTMPMETGRRTSIGRTSFMGAAPSTRPTVQFRLQECSGVIGHGVCGVL